MRTFSLQEFVGPFLLWLVLLGLYPSVAKAAVLERMDEYAAAFAAQEQEQRRHFLAELVEGIDPSLVREEVRLAARQDGGEGHDHAPEEGNHLVDEYLAFVQAIPKDAIALTDAAGETALVKAVRIGVADAVAVLLGKGAKVKVHDREGQGILVLTCNPEVLALLEKAGSVPETSAEWYHVGRCRNDPAAIVTAAAAGFLPALSDLGFRYLEGNGVEKDPARAVFWWRLAAAAGDVSLMNRLGHLYHDGDLIEADAQQAAYWWGKAAEQGDVNASANLGGLYEIGQGVARDEIRAAALFRLAAKNGSAWSANRLGLCYVRGVGVAPDMGRAAEWFFKAATGGELEAYCNLGLARDLTGDPGGALDAYAKGIAAGEQVLCRLRRGDLFRRQGEFAHALADFSAAAVEVPDKVEIGNDLCWTQLLAGKMELAQVQCRAAAAAMPDNPIARGNVGHLYLLQEENDMAEKEYQRALDLLAGDEVAFRQGLLADLELLAARGIAPERCRGAGAWLIELWRQQSEESK